MDKLKSPYGGYYENYCSHCDNYVCLTQFNDKQTFNGHQKKIIHDCATMRQIYHELTRRV